jgi:putative hydrolase of the HAD superfamily
VFDAIFAVEDEAPVPKLRRESSARIIDLAGFDPGRAVMIEDDVRDLEVPTEVGMATVWLCQQTGRPTPPSVDRRITRLTAFLDEIV